MLCIEIREPLKLSKAARSQPLKEVEELARVMCLLLMRIAV